MIAVAKTFMLSLVGYIGCIITPTDEILGNMQKSIDDFCIGPLKVAKNRRYEPPSAGGLGLINLHDFIAALQCTWVKRVHSHGVDSWRYDMLQLCYGNPFLLNTTIVKQNVNPIIYNIARSFERLSKTYYGTGKNYLKAYIFCNPIFVRGRGDNGILCRNFFGNGTPVNLLEKIAKLKLEDLLMRGGMKSLAQINTDFEVDFTLNTYMRLSEALMYFLEKKENIPPAVPIGIGNFLLSFDKGSRKIRKALSALVKKPDLVKINSVVTFHNISNVGEAVFTTTRNIICFWNFTGQKNTIREFAYKFMYNQLGLNTRVSHFVQNHSRNCSLCTLRNDNTMFDETFAHIFYDCPSTKKLHEKLISKYFTTLLNQNEQEKRRFWFLGEINGRSNLFVIAAVIFYNFLIWNMKLKKELSHFTAVENIWLELLDKLHKQSRKFREAVLLVNFDICRRWHG
jgi:hypothetical protein